MYEEPTNENHNKNISSRKLAGVRHFSAATAFFARANIIMYENKNLCQNYKRNYLQTNTKNNNNNNNNNNK